MSTPPLIVCLDRQALPQPLPPLPLEHRWLDYDNTSPEQVVERLNGASVAISNKVALRREQLERLPGLKLIAVAATGYNQIDVDACRALGIAVCNVPAYSTDAVAEHALMLMLALRHRLGEYRRAAAGWPSSPIFCVFGPPIGELKDATLCLIGGGHIGGRVAQLAEAFGMRVVRAERKGAAAARPGYLAFDEALARADILSLHCPLNADTRGIVGARELALLPPGAIVVNTARGGLIDEAALARALAEGRVGGAGLDVLEQEPPPAGNPLLRLDHPNLILTPHIAWASEASLHRMAEILIANIERFLNGAPQNRVA